MRQDILYQGYNDDFIFYHKENKFVIIDLI